MLESAREFCFDCVIHVPLSCEQPNRTAKLHTCWSTFLFLKRGGGEGAFHHLGEFRRAVSCKLAQLRSIWLNTCQVILPCATRFFRKARAIIPPAQWGFRRSCALLFETAVWVWALPFLAFTMTSCGSPLSISCENTFWPDK